MNVSPKVHAISAALVTLFGSVAALNWSSLVSPHAAAEIVTGLGAVKLVLSFFDNGATS